MQQLRVYVSGFRVWGLEAHVFLQQPLTIVYFPLERIHKRVEIPFPDYLCHNADVGFRVLGSGFRV